MNAHPLSNLSTTTAAAATAITLAVGSLLQAQAPIAAAAPTAPLALEDRYSEFANEYSDPHAADFNPLGKGNFIASPDMETVILRSDGSTGAGVPSHSSARTTDTLIARLEDGAREVLVRAHVRSNGAGAVKVFRRRENGTWREMHSRNVDIGGRQFRWISLSIEDRGDDRDLLHISAIVQRGNGDRQIARTTLEVDGSGQYVDGSVTYEDTRSDAHRVFESYVDLDGDGNVEHVELVTGFLEQGGFLEITDQARPDYRSANASGSGQTRWVNAFTVGQFDGDPELEVACVETHRISDDPLIRRRQMGARIVEQDAQGFVESSRKELSLRTLSATSAMTWREQYRVVGCDFDGAGSEAMVVVTDGNLHVTYKPGLNPGGLRPNTTGNGVNRNAIGNLDGLIDVVASSAAGSRAQQLAVLHEREATLARPTAGVDRVFVEPVFHNDGSFADRWSTQEQGTFELGGFRSQHLAAGDVDGDSMVLRYTGVKDFLLADPLIIGVLAAAPCWDAARVPTQNRDACSTSMEFSSSRGTALTVSSAYTATASAGISVSDLFDTFEAEVKATVSATLERSRTTGSQIRRSTTYIGGAQEDTVVFKGTLYRRYEYEIVGSDDPTRVGARLWIEDPVSTKVFQWPLQDYNQLVDASQRVALQHSIGSPFSYRNPAERDAALARHRGFLGTSVSVPRGTGATAAGLELTNMTSTSESRTVGIGAEFEFKHGVTVVGGSFAMDRTTVHEITMEQGTAFEGTVGAIDGNAYFTNEYDFGLLVLQPGMRPNGTVRTGQVPYWLITYWVD